MMSAGGPAPQGREPFIGDKNWDQYAKWEYDKDELQKQHPEMSEADAEHILTSRHGAEVSRQPAPGLALSAGGNPTPAKDRYNVLTHTPAPGEEHTKKDTGASGIGQIHNPFARIPLQILDAIGSTFFPALTEALPGTQYHHQQLVQSARAGVNEEQNVANEESKRALELAQGHHAEAEANASKADQPHTLQTDKGIMQWNPETKRFDIPAGQPPVKEEEEGRTVTTDQGIMQWDPKTKTYGIKVGNAPEKEGTAEKTLQDADGVWYHIGKDNTATPITVNGKPFQGKTGAEHTENAEQQFVDEFRKNNPKATVAEAQRAFKKNEQLPPQTDRGQNFIDPNTNKLVRVEPGGAVPKGALTAAGENAVNTPTAATRTMSEAAPKVLDLVNRVSQLVDAQEKTLGPAASRWNEFMAGKVGAPNADFTKLRTDVGLLQTALMRMHVGARGGEQMMEHFRDLIDTSKQSPENLRAALEEIKSYAEAVQGTHGGGGNTLPGGISVQDIDAEIARRKKK